MLGKNVVASNLLSRDARFTNLPIGKESTDGWLVSTTEVVGGTDTSKPLGAPDTFRDSDIGAEKPGIWTCTFWSP